MYAAMQEHWQAADLQRRACQALHNLALGWDNHEKIVQMGGVDIVHQAMQEHAKDAELQQWGCMTLSSLNASRLGKVSLPVRNFGI